MTTCTTNDDYKNKTPRATSATWHSTRHFIRILLMTCSPVEQNDGQDVRREAPAEQTAALQGGILLSASEVARSGMVTTSSSGLGCTASIVRTSGFLRKTWVLTAGHCFNSPPSSVSLSSPDGILLATGGTAAIHPGYAGSTLHDIALVYFPVGIPVQGNNGQIMREYFRPVLSVDPTVSTPATFAAFGAGDVTGGLNCNPIGTGDNTLRWASATFDNDISGEIGTLDTLSPTSPSSYLRHGDSGGPWMTASAMSTSTLLDNGVIAGVSSSLKCINDGIIGYNGTSTFSSSNLAGC